MTPPKHGEGKSAPPDQNSSVPSEINEELLVNMTTSKTARRPRSSEADGPTSIMTAESTSQITNDFDPSSLETSSRRRRKYRRRVKSSEPPPVPDPSSPYECSFCGTTLRELMQKHRKGMKRCSRDKEPGYIGYYCSKRCQKYDWTKHRECCGYQASPHTALPQLPPLPPLPPLPDATKDKVPEPEATDPYTTNGPQDLAAEHTKYPMTSTSRKERPVSDVTKSHESEPGKRSEFGWVEALLVNAGQSLQETAEQGTGKGTLDGGVIDLTQA